MNGFSDKLPLLLTKIVTHIAEFSVAVSDPSLDKKSRVDDTNGLMCGIGESYGGYHMNQEVVT